MQSFISENFIPVKIHIKEQPASFKRFGAQWTPTIAILDPGGAERHRFEGFLPADEFLSQLELGLAKAAFAHDHWKEAGQRFRTIQEKFPKTEAAPEALYWAGVSRYKESGDAGALAKAEQALSASYPNNVWTKKASVWAQSQASHG